MAAVHTKMCVCVTVCGICSRRNQCKTAVCMIAVQAEMCVCVCVCA